ncbi:hypothetical protein HPT25_20875 [Bacillus sp. BRMEA1]|uniref:Ig-like domain-containing protein n=1 Tax=Neobacillus endophyticus TaxID=2738405 RepID=UPI00156797CB|nr:Ig-like domain-containing protein [Neobacillus endophyticus]NRD79793.1 hypothetical protein [Neobacillus endophyticus]
MFRKALLCIFALVLFLAGAVSVQAANDTTPLILKDTSINMAEFHSGDTIKMQFTVENDYESGPAENADITLVHSSNRSIHSMMRYIGNNTYDFSYPAKDMLQGDWHVGEITLYDQAGNKQIYGVDSPLISKLSFRMLDGITDSTPPALTSIKLSQSTAKPGDTVIVSVGFDNQSAVSYGSLSLRHIETNDYSFIGNFYFNKTTGQIEAKITIPANAKNGSYDVGYLTLTDNTGNEINYWSEHQPILANAKLTVTGGVSDITGPVFQNVTVGQKELYPGDSLDVAVDGEDIGTGIKDVTVSFKKKDSQNSNDYFWGHLTIGSSNKQWIGKLNVPCYVTEGIYYIDQIYLQDQAGNTTFIRPSESFPTVKILPFYTGINSGTLLTGTPFDPMDGIRAFSNAEGDRTKDIVTNGSVDSSTNGIYLITYSVPSLHFPIMNSNIGTYYYNSYRWITVNDQQATDPGSDITYFNGDVEIGVPSNSTISLSDGKSVRKLSNDTTITKDGSYQVSTSGVGTAKAFNLLSMNQTNSISSVATKNSLKFVIDRQKPAAPVLSPIYSESVSVNGKSEAYSTVNVLSNGKYLASGKTNANGVFSIQIPKQTAGSSISVQAQDRAGNVSNASKQKVIYAPFMEPVSNVSTYITGKSLPKSTLKVYANGKLIKTGSADSNGYYKLQIPKQSAGTQIKLEEITSKGEHYTSLPVKVEDKLPPAPPRMNKLTTKSASLTGYAEMGSTVLVYSGANKIASGMATSKGTFNISIPKQKVSTVLTIYAVDAANNKSNPGYVKVQ